MNKLVAFLDEIKVSPDDIIFNWSEDTSVTLNRSQNVIWILSWFHQYLWEIRTASYWGVGIGGIVEAEGVVDKVTSVVDEGAPVFYGGRVDPDD